MTCTAKSVDDRPTVVVLCCDGLYQRYLAKRLHDKYHVTGIVVQREKLPKGSLRTRLRRYLNPLKLGRYIVARWDLYRSARMSRPILESMFGSLDTDDNFPSDIEIAVVENINHSRAIEFVKRLAPDIVCVNGTYLLREPMLALIPNIPLGVINLHTGLSPYTRGGNCNLYALLEGHPEWVGVTIHHIDEGIDSGDLILTEQVPMEADDNYNIIDARTFKLGIELLVEAVSQLAEGRAKRVPQWQAGRVYLRRTGFVYDPYQRFQVNRLLTNGLLKNYLADESNTDYCVKLVSNTQL